MVLSSPLSPFQLLDFNGKVREIDLQVTPGLLLVRDPCLSSGVKQVSPVLSS